MNPIRILIADDHSIVRDGLRELLDREADMAVVGAAKDGIEAVEIARNLLPDVVIMDIAMPRMGGLEAVQWLRKSIPECRIVVLSMYQREPMAEQLLQGGVLGYVLKGAPSVQILEAVRAAWRGEHFFSPEIRDLHDFSHSRPAIPESSATQDFQALSEREKQVFLLVVRGNRTAEISEVLCISPRTVEKHRANIIRKLHLSNPLDMAKLAVKLGIVEQDFWDS